MLPSALRRDGRAFEVTGVWPEPGFVLHPDYGLLSPIPRRITPTGHLIVLEILPKVEGRLGFSLRWDERPGLLDIDPVGGSPTAQANFRKGSRGYGGHHPVLLPDGRFDVNIRVPGLTVFRGVVSFVLLGVAMMNVFDLTEELTDFFSRLHHEPEIARSRANSSVVNIVLRHAKGCVFGARCVHEGGDELSKQASSYCP